MKKEVLISIKPKWCELIASGKKTIEVRKSKPKVETPFKCYIYCTDENVKCLSSSLIKMGRKKVIGEFICDRIIPLSITVSDPNHPLLRRQQPFTCLTDKEMLDYLGNGGKGYGWVMHDVIIYDEPKELSGFEIKKDCGGYFKWHKLSRPPQSWCYVEEVTE